MKILIVNAYIRNTGDAALLDVIIRQLREQWPQAEITIAALDDRQRYGSFSDCRNIGSMRGYAGSLAVGKLRRLARKTLMLAVEWWWAPLPALIRQLITGWLPAGLRAELVALETADMVVSPGGGYLNGADSLSGNLSIRYILLPMKLAERLGKPLFLAPQSFGPFGNARQQNAVRRVLDRAQLVLVREDKSMAVLRSIGVDAHRFKRAVDSGFAFETTVVNRGVGDKARPPKIGITAREWLDGEAQAAYEQALADFIVSVYRKYGADVSLVPQVTSELYQDDDRVVERRIAALARAHGAQVTQIDTEPDEHMAKRLYSELDYVIGTRFHSVIFTLTSYVPAIAVEYEHKTSGIMQDLGLQQWVIKIEAVTADRLCALFEGLIHERRAYLKALRNVLPGYIARAETVGPIIKQAYEQMNRPESSGAPKT